MAAASIEAMRMTTREDCWLRPSTYWSPTAVTRIDTVWPLT